MGEYRMESLDWIHSKQTKKSLFERISASNHRLTATGSEVAKTLLQLAKTGRHERLEEYCSEFLDACEDNGVENGKALLVFYSNVGDWYHHAKHHNIHGHAPPQHLVTSHLVARITGYDAE